MSSHTTNLHVLSWVQEQVRLCQPDRVVWCDGSEAECERLYKQAVNEGILLKLNPEKHPRSYYHRSNPNDVARVEQLTYICTPTEEEAGPTNNWAEPRAMYRRMEELTRGAMKGRTMYVVPYLMGPPGSPLAKVGVELTDSLYVVLNMRIMTRMGDPAWEQLKDSDDFNRGLHCLLDVHPDRRFVCHFPQDNKIISVGSGYGGNVLLGKKCLALRIASAKWAADPSSFALRCACLPALVQPRVGPPASCAARRQSPRCPLSPPWRCGGLSFPTVALPLGTLPRSRPRSRRGQCRYRRTPRRR